MTTPLNCFSTTLTNAQRVGCFKLWNELSNEEKERYRIIAFSKSKKNLTKFLPTLLNNLLEPAKCQHLKQFSNKILVKYFGLGKRPLSPFYQFLSDVKKKSPDQNLNITQAKKIWLNMDEIERNNYKRQFSNQYIEYKKSKYSELQKLKRGIS